jgi:hypothetical protein
MPDDALLLDLENLRSVYVQKQRAANTLQAGIKNLSGALSKTSRALQDFAENNLAFQDDVLSDAGEALNTARTSKELALDTMSQTLRREAQRLGNLTGALRDASNALQAQPVDVIRLDHAYTMLQSNMGQDGILDEIMPALQQELETAQQQLGTIFGSALRDAMAEMGVAVTGQPPRFALGRFELDANFLTRKASLLYGKTEVAKGIPLSLEGIVKTYQRELRNIEGRSEDGEAWIRDLYTAWEQARQSSSKTTTRANIVDVFYAFVLQRQSRAFKADPGKRTFRDYSRAQFIYDFSEFAQRQRLSVDGKNVMAHIATKSQADSASKSIWIMNGNSPYDGDYLADIEFS